MILCPVPTSLSTVTVVRMHQVETRDDAATTLTPTVTAGKVSIDPDATYVGRYYPVLVGTGPGGVPGVTYAIAPVDLPYDETLVVTPEELASEVGIPLPLSSGDRSVIEGAIRSAQTDVVAYLGRSITPTLRTESEVFAWPDGWRLRTLGDEDLVEVVSAVPMVVDGQISDYFTITFRAGLDSRHDPELAPIRRYVIAHAQNLPTFTTLWRARTKAEGIVRSLSAEGQSVSFEPASLGGGSGRPGDGSPGELPTLASLDRWRLAGRRIHQGPTRAFAGPYGGVL